MNPSSKLRIAVLMGGRSNEHEISLKSGEGMINMLDRSKHMIRPIIISRNNEWYVYSKYLGSNVFSATDYKKDREKSGNELVMKMTIGETIDDIIKKRTDLVLIALHGAFGEDGTIQGILDYVGIPYNGSGVMSSAIAMDKVMSKALYKKWGLLTPDSVVGTRKDWRKNKSRILRSTEERFGYPCVLKIPNSGSSFGMAIPQNRRDLERSFKKLFSKSGNILLEQYVKGREFSCGVLETASGRYCQALPVVEIIPKYSFYFDVKAKYEKGACEEIVPAPIAHKLTEKIQKMALAAHEILGCRTYSRSDMILSKSSGRLYLLETNTLPGFTATSLLPKEARATGIKNRALMDRIIEASLAKERWS